MPHQEKLHVVAEKDEAPTARRESTPRHLSKQEFARRLFARMSRRHLQQADLARLAGISRNNVSTYIRGQCFPNRKNLEALAEALDCTPEELLPNVTELALTTEVAPAVQFTQSSGDPRKSWITINRLLATSVALEIMQLIEKADREEEK